jgi:hypothetical protein
LLRHDILSAQRPQRMHLKAGHLDKEQRNHVRIIVATTVRKPWRPLRIRLFINHRELSTRLRCAKASIGIPGE